MKRRCNSNKKSAKDAKKKKENTNIKKLKEIQNQRVVEEQFIQNKCFSNQNLHEKSESTDSASEVDVLSQNIGGQTPDYTSPDEADNLETDDELYLTKVKPITPAKNFNNSAVSMPNVILTPNARFNLSQTAYLLWFNMKKDELGRQYPAIDFQVISIHLKDLWSKMSNRQKSYWHNEAQKLADKYHITPQNSGRMFYDEDNIESNSRSILSKPIDVAAYLVLLGESLNLIGNQLIMKPNKRINLRGCLSVLLDSLLCSMASVLCLTQELCIDLHGDSFQKTLDNIAFIMPGL